MKHVISHKLDMATAKKVTDKAFDEYSKRFPDYQPTLRWQNDRKADVTFRAKGIALNGAMLIDEGSIALDLDVPFLFKPFQKMAIEVIDREVRAWLEKASTGAL